MTPKRVDGERDLRLRNLFGALLAFDVSASITIAIVFTQISVFHVQAAIGLSIARGLAWFGLIYLQLAPVRGWQSTPSDDNLLRADALLQVFGARQALSYGLGWFVTVLLQFSTAYARDPSQAGPAEFLLFALLAFSCVLGTWSLMNPLLENLLLGYQLELSEALAARQRRPSRPTRSMTARTVGLLVGICIACVLGTATMGVSWRLDGIRAAGVESAMSQATHAAAGLDDSKTTQRLSTEELPPPLAKVYARGESEANSLRGYHPGQQRGWAALRAADGDWVVASAAGDEQVGFYGLLVSILALSIGLTLALPAYAQGRAMELPIEQFGAAARRFAEQGELRALERVVPLSGDSISRLAISFGQMFDNLEQLAVVAEAVAQGDLRAQLEQPGELHDAFRGMVSRLRESAMTLHETAAALTDATIEIDALTLRQDRSAAQQAERSSQASLSLASLSNTAQGIAQTATEVLLDAERAEHAGRDMSAQLSVLNEHTETIDALLTGIREVADRSDLLALNGALEATRAGELGRNFSLVASEMRRLAERVANLVSEVDQQLGLMRKASRQTLIVAREREQLDRRTADAARAISRMTQDQSLETEKVSAGISEIAAQSMITIEVTAHTRSAVEAMREQAISLEALGASFEL